MINNNLLKENFKKILDIKKVFENAKNDNWKTFLDKINKLDKNILKEQLDYYGDNTEKVKNIRVNIIKSILNWTNISNEDIEYFKKTEKEKYDWKDIFRSWKNFSILYSIYYYDKKDFVNKVLLDLNNKLVKDLWITDLVKINIVDFQWAQNFWLDNFWTAIYNKSHKSQKTALQLNIVSSWKNYLKFNGNEIAIWLWCWPEVKKEIENHKKIKINDLTYEFILSEFSKYKNNIINDTYMWTKIITDKINYWTYSPWKNASRWDEFYDKWIMWLWWAELWDLNNYKSKKEITERLQEIYNTDSSKKNDSTANYDFLSNMNIWDIIIAKKWKHKYIWYWIVEWNYEFQENNDTFKSIRKVKWIKKWEWEEVDMLWISLKTLTNISKYTEYVEKLKILLWINSSNNNIMKKLNKTSELLNSKKQIILYWPPGTGKTYSVKSIIENHSWENYNDLKNEWRVEFITFHQSFSYEEFIEWIKPDLDWDTEEISYKIEDWIFKKIVNKAKSKWDLNINIKINELKEKLIENPIEINENSQFILKYNWWKTFSISPINTKNPNSSYPVNIKNIKDFYLKNTERNMIYNSTYVVWILEYLYKNWLEKYENSINNNEIKNYYLIIDEINRWNISKIFGELITLLEADKRIWEENEVITKLPYSKEDFWIPSNLFIVATMNTSDKSIVSLDTALRRRFWFKEMLPNYSLDWLNKDIEWINLSKLLQKINNRIEYLIDKDHLIWHSYFLKANNISDLKLIIYNEILPLLEEYFYWEEEKIRLVLWKWLFKQKQFDNNLFENKNDFDNDEIQYEINETLSNEEFISAIKNIIKSDEEK